MTKTTRLATNERHARRQILAGLLLSPVFMTASPDRKKDGVPLRAWQRWLIRWLCVSLALLPMAGCETAPRVPELKTVHIAAIVIDEQRLAGRDEAVALTVLRNGARLGGTPGHDTGDWRPRRNRSERDGRDPLAWLGDAYLRPDTAATIGSLDDILGSAFIKVRGFFAVQTRLARAVVKGTKFLVRGRPDGTLEVTMFEGAVEMSSRMQAWPPVTLNVGQTGIASLQAPQPTPASEAELQSTRQWVERVEKLLAQSGAGVSNDVASVVPWCSASASRPSSARS